MANMLPPVRGQAFSFLVNLVKIGATDYFQETVTLAAGDIQVSKDGGQYANLATFPPPEIDLAAGADSGTLYVTLTAEEMTADVVSVLFRDAEGGQWQSVLVTIYTSGQTLNDIAAQTDDIGVAGAGLTAVPGAVWEAPVRTLTQSAAQVAAVVAGSSITVTRGDTWTIALTGLGDMTAMSKLWFTVKGSESQPDTEALLQIEKTGGLLRLNGAAGTASDATLVVNDATLGNITITVKPAATVQIGVTSAYYDVQQLTTTGAVLTMTMGAFSVTRDYTRAVS